nr:ComF family protein [Kibdelosporangium phytohabitans]
MELLVPSCCAGCDRPGEVLCGECRSSMSGPRLIDRGPGLPPMYALGQYTGVARRAVIAYKERGRRELAASFGSLLTDALRELPPADLVPVPSRPRAVRARGFEHMALVAAHTPAVVRPLLRLDRRVRDSVGLDADQRAHNLAGRLTCVPTRARVVLIDDVVTTGVTATACCSALTRAGAAVVGVVALTAT